MQIGFTVHDDIIECSQMSHVMGSGFILMKSIAVGSRFTDEKTRHTESKRLGQEKASESD